MQLPLLPDAVETAPPRSMLPLYRMPKTISVRLWIFSLLSYRGLCVQLVAGG
jgi:hypothetical protein